MARRVYYQSHLTWPAMLTGALVLTGVAVAMFFLGLLLVTIIATVVFMAAIGLALIPLRQKLVEWYDGLRGYWSRITRNRKDSLSRR